MSKSDAPKPEKKAPPKPTTKPKGYPFVGISKGSKILPPKKA